MIGKRHRNRTKIDMEKAIYFLAAAIVVAGFAAGGVYTTEGQGTGGSLWRMNRFTGEVTWCGIAAGGGVGDSIMMPPRCSTWPMLK